MKNWKRLLSMLMAMSLLTTSVAGFAETEVPAEIVVAEAPGLPEEGEAEPQAEVSISLSDTQAALYTGETLTLTADVTGASADEIVWSSSKDSVATVDNGVVTGVSSGSAVITAAIGDVTAQCDVSVSVRLKGFNVSSWPASMTPGGHVTVSAAADPSDAPFDTIAWSSDDESVAKVSLIDPEDPTAAQIDAVAPGRTTIRLTCGNVSSAYELVVDHLPLTELTMQPATALIDVNEKLVLNVIPNEHAQLGDVVWTSANDEIATVKNGVVTGMHKGTVEITAAVGEITATCVVTVQIPLTHIDMNLKTATLLRDGILSLSVVPNAGAELGEVVWSSSDENVATVENGWVNAVGVGQCEITAACGGLTATCSISVYVPLSDLILSAENITLQPGDALQLSVQPNEGAVLDGVAYVSSDEGVVTVQDGLITAVAPGSAVITVSSGEVTKQCAVTVKHAVVIGDTPDMLYAGDTLQLDYTYQFADVEALQSAVWSVSDAQIASIGPETGLLSVTGKGAVTVTITVTGVNGNTYTDSVSIDVVPHTEGIRISSSSLLLDVSGAEQLTAELLPEGAVGEITWSSADPLIAEVSADGMVTAKALGSTVITAAHGDFTAVCTVQVEILPQRVDLYTDSMVIGAGKKGTVRYEIRPLDATVKDIEWASSDESIATVSAAGVVRAVKKGWCEITGTTQNGLIITIPVMVVSKDQAVTSVSLNTSSKTLQRTQTYQLKASVSPKGAVDRSVVWAAEHPEVATVDANGLVTAVAPGTTRILAATSNGLIKTCTVTVVPLKVSKVSLSQTKATLYSGDSLQLEATLAPADADDLSLKWTSSKKSVATVDENGVVTALKAGTATITCKSASGKTATCKVTVKKIAPVMDVTKRSIGTGDSFTVQVTYKPATQNEMQLTWYSDKPSVANVDANGVVTAYKNGTARIYCKTQYGVTDSVTVTVKAISPVMSITKQTVATGETFAIGVTYSPATVQDMGLTWRSSKPAVADVDASGVVTAYAPGSAKIYCETKFGKTDYATITVKDPSPVMDITEKTLAEGMTYAIALTYSPAVTQPMQIQWRSANEAVATVDENGVVTAVSAGTAKIICMSQYGTTDTCTITVKKAAPVMDITKKTIVTGEMHAIGVTFSPQTDLDMGLTWRSANEKVATVDADGVVTGVKAGTAKIYCETKDGKTDYCTITVKDPVPAMNIAKKTISVGMTYAVTVKYSPDTAQDTGLTWRSANEKVVTVDANGVITGVKAGTAKIYCETKYGTTDYCTITVKNPVPAMDITKKTIAVGMTYAVSVTYSPAAGEDTGLTWRSANENVATVDADGVITGVKNGTAKIYCETKYGTSDYCTITVATAKPVIPAKLTVAMGGTAAVTLAFSPVTTEDMGVVWESSNKAVATVDENGIVTGVKGGTAKITCRTRYGDSDTCTVTVKTPTPVMDRTKMTMYTGETFTIPVSFSPATEVDVPLQWRTSKPSVATVNAEGVITAISKGTVTITCLTEDNKKDTCTITVKPMPVQELHVTNPYGDLAVGGKYTLIATCYPEHAADKTVVWKSSNPSIAKVNTTTGEITCLKPGTVEILARAYDHGDIIVPITLTVKAVSVQDFKLDVSEIILEADKTQQVNMTFTGDLNGTVPVWTSSDERIATVDQNGLITAVGNGIAAVRCMIGGETRTVVVAVPRSGEGKYRVLIAGEYTNSKVSGYLNFAVNGLVGVDSAFDLANISGDRYIIERLNNPSEGTLMGTIDSFFADTEAEDVSVLYLMSHGLNVDGEYRWGIAGSKAYITEKELTSALEKIKGEVVLVLVSCYSGQYVENYTTSSAAASLKGAISTVNGSRPGNKKISIITSQTGTMTGAYTAFPTEKSYDFFCRLFAKALGWDQENATAYDEMYADANNDGVITLFELASYLENNIQQEIDDHVDQYGEQSVANTAKNKGLQKVEYYLTNPDLVIYSRVKERLGKS